jgi:hypothetical protein
MTTDYYADDLSQDVSLITLEEADAILTTTLHGFNWTTRATADRAACADDPERTPARDLDKAALQDATAVLNAQSWRGRRATASQTHAFARVGLSLPEGQVIAGIPTEVRRATAILAASLVAASEQSMTPETFKSYQIGQVRGEFRAPPIDDLPRPVRQLIAPLLDGGASWSRVKP